MLIKSRRTDVNSSVTWTVSMFGFFRRSETLKNLKQASSPNKSAAQHFFPVTKKSAKADFLVPGVGLEPTSLARHDFKSCAYTIPPSGQLISDSYLLSLRPGAELNRRIKILQIFALPLGYQANR
jgi:hypothetical protein